MTFPCWTWTMPAHSLTAGYAQPSHSAIRLSFVRGHRADLVGGIERRHLVGLGEGGVVEDDGDEEVEAARADGHHRLADVDELGGACADRVDAEYRTVLGIDEQLEHAVLVAGHQAARELAVACDSHHVGRRVVGQLLLGAADISDLGDRVDARRDEFGLRMYGLLEGVQGGDATLLHRGRGEPAAGDVTDREDVWHAGPEALVDL